MLFIQATDKYKDFKTTKDFINLLAFVSVSFALTALSWFLYHTIIITLTLTISSLIYFYFLAKSPQKIEIIIYNDKIKIDKIIYNYKDFVFWGVGEVGDKLEIAFQKQSINANFLYFYIDKKPDELEKIVSVLSQNIPYNEEIIFGNKIQTILRYFGLK